MQAALDDQQARDLIRRIAGGDEDALTRLHTLMAARIYAFVYHRLDDRDAAESAVTETLWEVWKSAGRFRGESRVSTWVLGIARYKAMELRRQAMPEHEDLSELEDVLPADDEDGEAMLERWQRKQALEACIRKLSYAHRECLQLVHLEGLPLADVAQIQGVPANTVKTRMFHVRRNLKACLELALA